MSDSPSMRAGLQWWLNGVQAEGERPLEAHERRALERRHRRQRVLFGAAICVVLGWIGWVALWRLSPQSVPLFLHEDAARSVLLSPVIVTLAGWLAWRSGREAAQLRRELAETQVVRFARGESQLEVHPSTGRILGRRHSVLLRRVAPLPEEVLESSLAPDAASPEVRRDLRRRRMTAAERQEILAHAGSLRGLWRSAGLWIATALLALSMIVDVAAARPMGVPARIVKSAVAVAIVFCHWRAARAYLLGRRLQRDADEGWVLRFVAGEHAGHEGLLASDLAWSEGGRHAPWRTGAGRPR